MGRLQIPSNKALTASIQPLTFAGFDCLLAALIKKVATNKCTYSTGYQDTSGGCQ